MNIAITDDLRRLLRMKVEDGQFPDEEAVVREALRNYLTAESREHPRTSVAVEGQVQREPGPFLADEMILPPVTLLRPSPELACSCLDDSTRLPDRFPGE